MEDSKLPTKSPFAPRKDGAFAERKPTFHVLQSLRLVGFCPGDDPLSYYPYGIRQLLIAAGRNVARDSDRVAPGDAAAAQAIGVSGAAVYQAAAGRESASAAVAALAAAVLRCLAIALLAVALARPSVPSLVLGDWILTGLVGAVLLLVGLTALLALLQRRGRWVTGGFGLAAFALAIVLAVMLSRVLGRQETKSIGNEQAPVAAVLAFDTSPRMQYLWQNRTRLDQAREIAQWLVRQLPADSELAVLDSRPGGAAFAVDLAAAQRSVERLETTGVPLPLVDVAERAIKLTQASQKAQRSLPVQRLEPRRLDRPVARDSATTSARLARRVAVRD